MNMMHKLVPMAGYWNTLEDAAAVAATATKVPKFAIQGKRGRTLVPAIPMGDPQAARRAINAGGTEESRTAQAMVILADVIKMHPDALKSKPDSKNAAGDIIDKVETELFGEGNLPNYWRQTKSRMLAYYRLKGAPWVDNHGTIYLMPLKYLDASLFSEQPTKTQGQKLVDGVKSAIANGCDREHVETALHLLADYRETLIKAEQNPEGTKQEAEDEVLGEVSKVKAE